MNKKLLYIGMVFSLALIGLFWGVLFLKNISWFSEKSTYYIAFSDVNDISALDPVQIKGFKVGYVENISVLSRENFSFLAKISITSDVKLYEGTVAYLSSGSLIGGGAISLDLPTITTESRQLTVSDTIPGRLTLDIFSKVTSILPNEGALGGLLSTMDSTFRDANRHLMGSRGLFVTLSSTLNSFFRLSEEMRHVTKQNAEDIRTLTENLRQISNGIKTQILPATNNLLQRGRVFFDDFDRQDIPNRMDTLLTLLNTVSRQLTSRKGTVSRLLYEDTMYNRMNRVLLSADSLISAIRNNPKKYIRVKVF